MPKLNLQAELNGPQLLGATMLEGPTLIIAGAGSGKTRVITYRIAYMLERGIPQSSILALTFTNKAAREMEERIKELTGKKLQSLTVSTFHAFGSKILREEIEKLGFQRNFSIYDETDRRQLIKDSLRECRFPLDTVDTMALGQLFSSIKIGTARWEESGQAQYKPVYQEYQSALQVYNAVDFDDLLTLPLQLFAEYAEILAKYHSRYRYIMIDEFQDTSFIQYRLMRLLALGYDVQDSSRSATGKPPNICVVGDDDQSIYSWRGANYENILLFERDFPEVREITLEQNYRSTTTILEAANGVISHNANRKDKQLWSSNSGGKPIEIFYPRDETKEGEFIALRIHELRKRENLRFDDFAILMRTNSMTRNIEEALLAENIPYRVTGGQSFFQRKEIKDVLSYLRIVANQDDDVNLLRIINTPPRGIGKATVAALTEMARRNHSSLWDAMSRYRYLAEHGQEQLFQDAGPGKSHAGGDLVDFMALIDRFQEQLLGSQGRKGWTLGAAVRSLVDAIDYWSFLVTEHKKNEKVARWKYSNIMALIQSIENWEQDPDNLDPTLYPFLNRISLLTRDEGEEDQQKGAVSVMTIHAAKGLEFPAVFIAGAEEGLIPHARSLEEGSEEEERRLFYVAITRAREKLVITACKKRRRMQSSADCVPSHFLEEIPAGLTEFSEEEPEVEGENAERIFAALRDRFKLN